VNLPSINQNVNNGLDGAPFVSSFLGAFQPLPVDTRRPPDEVGEGGVDRFFCGSILAPLGSNWEIAQPPPRSSGKDSLYFRLRKWGRQAVYREILQTKAARFCHRAIAPIMAPGRSLFPGKSVDIYKSKKGSFGYGGLITCGSVWVCPVCASKIAEHRRVELKKALDVVPEVLWSGAGVFHLTLTAPHHMGESLLSLLDRMAHARRLMLNRKPWKRFERSVGLQGSIRALEVTHGHLNGWHVHFHVLLICANAEIGNLDELKNEIFQQWRPACLTAGLEAPSEKHGVDLAHGESASNYVAKWGVEDEMTKGHIKQGFDGNLSPFEFLDKIIDGDDRYKALFQEFHKAFKGRRQLVWSKGLRDLLRIGSELSDEEISEGQDPDSELFAQVTARQWSVILKKEKRGQVLEACRGGKESLMEYLRGL
jgi:hypothetical protein